VADSREVGASKVARFARGGAFVIGSATAQLPDGD